MLTNSLRGQEEQIFYSAVTFRRLLDSLARPGKLNQLEHPTFLGEPPHYHRSSTSTDIPLNFYALGALWTLLDREVSFLLAANGRWLDQDTSTAQWLVLRSGATVAEPGTADFAFFCEGSSNGLLPELNVGNLLEPESSTTAIYCVERLEEGFVSTRGAPLRSPMRTNVRDHAPLRTGVIDDAPSSSHNHSLKQKSLPPLTILELSGPGIQGKCMLRVLGLDEGEIALIEATRRNYPLGIDIYLVDAIGQCVGLPRTTKVRLAQAHS